MSYVKGQEKSTLKLDFIRNSNRLVLATNAQQENNRKVNNYCRIIIPNSRQRRKLFISNSQYTAEGRMSVR